MTRETYIRITGATRSALNRLPGKDKLLRLPTYLCAAVYMGALLSGVISAVGYLI